MKRPLSSISDANITTLIAAIVLFAFGTGPIKGFAVTLSADVLIKANKSLSVGAKILFESDQHAIILSRSEEIFRIKFSIPKISLEP